MWHATESVITLPLSELDRPAAGRYDHLTSIYVPPVPEAQRRPDFDALVQVIARLRAPDGCPWDREQTYVSLKRFVLEESYEVLEAIDSGDPERLCDELGDLLLQVVLQAQLGREDGFFDIRDVIGGITDKLIRRHPHVFGDVQVANCGGSAGQLGPDQARRAPGARVGAGRRSGGPPRADEGAGGFKARREGRLRVAGPR